MRTLYVIRHAKSSWTYPHLEDYDRPLGVRGRRDVVKMAKYVKRNLKAPELILTSPASRAFNTALFIADGWSVPEEKVVTEARFYHADDDEIIQVIANQKDYDILAVAGHNPGLTQLVNALTSGSYIDNLPTCGIVGIQFPIESWDEIEHTQGEQKFFITPKSIPK